MRDGLQLIMDGSQLYIISRPKQYVWHLINNLMNIYRSSYQ